MAGIEKRVSNLEQAVTRAVAQDDRERITTDLPACGREFERFMEAQRAGLDAMSAEQRAEMLDQWERDRREFDRGTEALERICE